MRDTKTKKYTIQKIYYAQKNSVRKGRVTSLNYTKEELIDFITSDKNFNTIYDNWVKSNYKKDLIPSIDRIDDYGPYSLDNIQLVTWGENNNRGYADRRNGVNNKASKAVIKIFGTVVFEYCSISEAARQNNKHISYITRCCKNPNNKIWSYA